MPLKQTRAHGSSFGRIVKRIMDLLIVLLSIPVAVPLVVFFGMCVFFSMGLPVFFCQDRVGLEGRIFRMYKLRTMENSFDKSTPTVEADPRITKLGVVLRKHRIDEVPQLLNVLLGHMSVVGPRPEQPRLVEQYSHSIPNFGHRHVAKPGITGLAQVRFSYAANESATRKKLRYDLLYVRRQSLLLDCWILLRTVSVLWKAELSR